jgi:catechol 2,3-dioxygenase-like lactoylglutathione lyase family enzyme
MLDHVTIRASDRDASERFYDLLLRVIGVEHARSGEHYAVWDDFSLARADDENPVTRRLHIAFAASSRAVVDEFARADRARPRRLPRRRRRDRERVPPRGDGSGLTGQRRSRRAGDLPPRLLRPFVLDPDGNNVEVVNHNR